jgi:hypothetical protein
VGAKGCSVLKYGRQIDRSNDYVAMIDDDDDDDDC